MLLWWIFVHCLLLFSFSILGGSAINRQATYFWRFQFWYDSMFSCSVGPCWCCFLSSFQHLRMVWILYNLATLYMECSSSSYALAYANGSMFLTLFSEIMFLLRGAKASREAGLSIQTHCSFAWSEVWRIHCLHLSHLIWSGHSR